MAIASLGKEMRGYREAWRRTNMPLFQVRSGDPWVKGVLMGLAVYSKTT